MQRIWITGSAGAGKTTLANRIGKHLGIEVTHRDAISWYGNWKMRAEKEQIKMVQEATRRPKWIFDSNRFTAAKVDGRYDTADTIIALELNRWLCLSRIFKRYRQNKGTVRPDLVDECYETVDFEIVKYILWDYPKRRKRRMSYLSQARQDGKKVYIFKTQKQIDRWLKERGIQ